MAVIYVASAESNDFRELLSRENDIF